MAGLIKKFLVSTSIAAGMTALTGIPALAQIENPTVQGGEYKIYEAVDTDGDGIVDATKENSSADIVEVLKKVDGTPGGNIELFSDSEDSKYNTKIVEDTVCTLDFGFGCIIEAKTTTYDVTNFANANVTSISGMLGGKELTLSSLTAKDWFGDNLDTSYGADNLANTWFDQFLNAAGQNQLGLTNKQDAFYSFLGMNGFQRTSDANISYVDLVGKGDLKIGLAGHFDLKEFYSESPEFASIVALLPDGFQASEVVKYEYDGAIDYAFGFTATESGLVALDDGKSHTGNYEVSVPEPSS
ncbi:MAG: hypothetical protein F6K35_33380, partial [Okeania sp. SIO2H7]|nr:hypothetical protein [Okeania sp. SIO2H7]